MLRDYWNEFEKNLSMVAEEVREAFLEKFNSSKRQVQNYAKLSEEEKRQKFEEWGRAYVQKLKEKGNSERVDRIRDHFIVLVRNLGLNEELLKQTFQNGKKEVLDPVFGEIVAIIAMVLGWSQKDKELFSQSLGEIGVAGVFAAKPFLCLIAICGLAYGYQENFHKEAFKKGGVLSAAGLAVAFCSPGGFVGLLAAIVTVLYLNKKIGVGRPVETQLKEILSQMKNGDFFREIRKSWSEFEDFLSKLFKKDKMAYL